MIVQAKDRVANWEATSNRHMIYLAPLKKRMKKVNQKKNYKRLMEEGHKFRPLK